MIRNKIVFFVVVVTVFFLEESKILKGELRKKINALNSDVVDRKMSYYKNDPSVLTTFPVHEK